MQKFQKHQQVPESHLHVTRPGIVIGRKGSGIENLTEKLQQILD